MVKVIAGPFGAFQIFDNLVLKTPSRREKQSDIWTSGMSINCIQDTFDS